MHRLLERMDFRRPVAQTSGPGRRQDAQASSSARSPAPRYGAVWAAAPRSTREQRFAFALAGVMITGVFDVLAEEAPGRLLVVDYKTDRVPAGEDPSGLVARRYGLQQSIYALAALRTGAAGVEVIHAFLEDVEHAVSSAYTAADQAGLQDELARRCEPARTGSYFVTEAPEREVCAGCPAEGGLCSWPVAMTRRTRADQLF